MTQSFKWAALAAAISCLPLSAQAHRSWMLPSATVLSGTDLWVTIDAAISNDLFYFEHHAMRLGNLEAAKPETPLARPGRASELRITAPDGTEAKAQNGSMGRYRTTFDVHLTQSGTYKVAVVNEGIFASYKEGGANKRWSGTAEAFAKEVKPDATDLRVSQMQGRTEVFVTAGKPTKKVLEPSGVGLELAPVTHPNDLVAGEKATFRLLLDGKPAADLPVTVIPGGIRYRDQLKEMTLKTDSDGAFSVTWEEPGMYWLNASLRDDKASIAKAQRRASYTATLEVLPP